MHQPQDWLFSSKNPSERLSAVACWRKEWEREVACLSNTLQQKCEEEAWSSLAFERFRKKKTPHAIFHTWWWNLKADGDEQGAYLLCILPCWGMTVAAITKWSLIFSRKREHCISYFIRWNAGHHSCAWWSTDADHALHFLVSGSYSYMVLHIFYFYQSTILRLWITYLSSTLWNQEKWKFI